MIFNFSETFDVDEGNKSNGQDRCESTCSSDEDSTKAKDKGKSIKGKNKRKGRKKGKTNHVDDDAGTIHWPNFDNPNDCGEYVPPQKQAKLGDVISEIGDDDADDMGTIHWPNFDNPSDCGDYVPPQKQAKLDKIQSKITNFFKSQNGGLPHIGLRIPSSNDRVNDKPGASRKKSNTSRPNDKPDRPNEKPSTSKPNDKPDKPNDNSGRPTSHNESNRDVDNDDSESLGLDSSDDESSAIQADWDLVNQVHNRRFQSAEYVYNLRFNRQVRGSLADILVAMHEMLEKILNDVKANQNMHENDFIRLIIMSPELREPIAMRWALVKDLDVEAIFEYIQQIIQSNEDFYIHSGLTFVVKHVRNPVGGGFKRRDPIDNDEFVIFKRGLITVAKKDDNMCFGKAIIKALYHPNGLLFHENAKSIANGNNMLMTLTKGLYAKAGVPEGRVSSEQYQKFQDVLANDDVRLIIYSM